MFKAAALLALLAGPAGAYTQADLLDAEVLPGWRTAEGRHMAALSIRLASGWKTYWRSPGDAGIPPVLDFAGSGNVQAVQLHWPSPVVFEVNGLTTIGYHDRLVLPFEVTPDRAGQPITIRLNVDMGVCRDVCVPAHLDLAATLPAGGQPDTDIRSALDAVPGPAKDAGLSAIHCALAPIRDGLTMTTSLRLPSLGQTEAVVIEPADGAIWVSQSATTRTGDTLTATTDLVAPTGAPFALDRSTLRVTVIGDRGAVEVTGCPAP